MSQTGAHPPEDGAAVGPAETTSVVFVADDDPSFLTAITRLLRAAGYEVEGFDSAEAFLSRGPTPPHGCLILDLDMPGQSGLQLQETLARAGRHLPIVFVTGHGDVPQSVRAMKDGAVDFLTKPVARDDLFNAIERALGRAARREAHRVARAGLQARFERLTPREREVFRHVVAGMLNKQIASELGIGLRTIKVHRAHVMEKMEATTLPELVRMADELGIARSPIDPEPVFADTPATNLLVPRARAHLVRRDRLRARLEAGTGSGLVLLCAPTGYGKTTAVVDWLRSRAFGMPSVAWLSVDEGDNDPTRFARGLVGALRADAWSVRARTPVVLPIMAPLPLRTVCTMIINELMASPRDVFLVLDDYHVIREPVIHQALAFLLTHLPPCLHLIVLTREEPPFPLAQLRASAALCEFRITDLRFTVAETAAFLRDVMEIPVTEAAVASLHARTEGWPAALQLVALSISPGDAPDVVADFDGNRHGVVDDLSVEVLARQPGPVQTFLLRTSMLDRLNPSLCQAVLGREQSGGGVPAMLDRVERANLFLTRLEGEQPWYRYHPFFAELLRARLQRTEPNLPPQLHGRASGWYEAHGFVQEAIRHALAVPDLERAARLIEQHGMSVFHLGQLQTILEWFHALPATVRRARPRLSLIHAYALYGTNHIDAAGRRLRAVESQLRPDLRTREARLLGGNAAMLRSLMAAARGDLAGSLALAAQAADFLAALDPKGRGFALVWAAQAFRISGDVTPESERAVAMAVEQAKAARAPVALRFGLVLLAHVHVLQGRLDRAADAFAEAERALGLQVTFATIAYCVGLGNLLRERNDLDPAERLLRQGVEAISDTNIVMPFNAVAGYRALAQLRQARGNAPGALAAIEALVTLATQRAYDATVLHRTAAIRAQLWLMQENLAAAAQWAERSGLNADDEVSYARELEYLVLARVLIARGSDAAPPLLDRLLADAESHARLGSAIEILVLRALAHEALGDRRRALDDAARALALAEPAGYIRVFVDEGAPMASLLRRAHARKIAPEYAMRLLSTFGH